MTFQSIMSTSNDYIVYWRVISVPSLCNFFSVAKQKYLLDTYPPPVTHTLRITIQTDRFQAPFCICFFQYLCSLLSFHMAPLYLYKLIRSYRSLNWASLIDILIFRCHSYCHHCCRSLTLLLHQNHSGIVTNLGTKHSSLDEGNFQFCSNEEPRSLQMRDTYM